DRPLTEAADPNRPGTHFNEDNSSATKAKNKDTSLELKLVPKFITSYWTSFAQLVAGLILLISVPFRGTKFTILIVAAAALAFIGERYIPQVSDLLSKDKLAMAGGGALAFLTLMFFRK